MPALLWTLLGAFLSLQASRSETLEVVVKEPQGPIVVGSDVTLQCVASGMDLSSCKFQMYHRWVKSWINIDTSTTFRCWFYKLNVSRESGELLLQVKDIYKWHAGPYRCVSNGSEGQIVSDSITIPLQYLNDIAIHEPHCHFTHYMRSPRVIRVMRGKSVEVKCSAVSSQPPLYQWKKEGSDWIYPNSSLRIEEISPEEGGMYTCKATHPSIPSLSQTKSVLIKVVKEPLSSLQLNEINLILALVLPIGVLLLTAVGIAMYIRKVRKANGKKMRYLDDEILKTPIWKGGSSLGPITVSDSVPLVM